MIWTSTSHWRSLRACTSICRRKLFNTPHPAFPRLGRDKPLGLHGVPSFREELIRTTPVQSFKQVVKPGIQNQIVFWGVGTILLFGYASAQTNVETDRWTKQLTGISATWTGRYPTSDEMRRTQFFQLARRLQEGVNDVAKSEVLPVIVKRLVLTGYAAAANAYLEATAGKRLCWKIIALNTVIWFAWQVPRLRPAMTRHFTHHPLSGKSYTMLTSVFSHKSFFHLLFNSMALAGFGSSASHFLSKQQDISPTGLQESTVTYHFLAFYLSAGLFSSLVSHVVTARIFYPRLVSKLASTPVASAAVTGASAKAAASSGTKAASEILPSLGASGAIYSALTLSALAFPALHVTLVIPPWFTIPIQWGVGGVVLLDCVGVLRGWRLFDHYAHLGGAAFGVAYWAYGGKLWDEMRMRQSRSIRKDGSDGKSA